MFDKIKDAVSGVTGGDDLGDLPLGGFEKYLEGVTYPIGIDDLKAVVQGNGAPEQLTNALDGVGTSGKTSFSSQDDVVDSLKGQLKNIL